MTSTPQASSPAAARRWRPRARGGPICNQSLGAKVCRKRGAHYCEPRADRVVAFFALLLVHTKGTFARDAFVLDAEQEHQIVRPLFGEVLWSKQWGRYVRRYTVAGVVVARKNGKSELAAGIALYLLIGDDEEGAEVYGAAKDTKQAGKVWEPAKRMRLLKPELAARLGVNVNSKRIFDQTGTSGSYYEVITADALGELGHNPHGFVLDEVLSQPNGDLWDAMRTGAGTRTQPLFVLITTETNQPTSFGADIIDELERIQADPKRNPGWFAYVRKLPKDERGLEELRRQFPGHPRLPVSLDAWDEANWYWPNPALGTFLSIEALRQEALEARNDPTKENGFRQYRLNQRVQQVTRWLPLHVWDNAGDGRAWPTIDETDLEGQRCFGGLDLAATTDLASLCWRFPGRYTGAPATRIVWRFWVPEARVGFFDGHTGGQFSRWVNEGLVEVTEGDWIDFEHIRARLDKDLRRFRCVELGYDPWAAPDTVQWMQARGMTVFPVRQTYEGLSPAMNELMRRLRAHEEDHGGNPVVRWMADGVEIRHPADQPDVIRPVKPDRQKSGVRIDGIVADVIALATELQHERYSAVAATGRGPAEAPAAGGNFFRPDQRLQL